MRDAVTYYAIGDVHGMDDMLAALHDLVFADIAQRGVRARIVHIGDYVDRGEQSRQVVERLMRLSQERDDVICLKGNHEDMMVGGLAGDDHRALANWLYNGGDTTLASYGGEDGVPQGHLEWMEALPLTLRDDDQRLLFVHAGIEPRDFPDVDEEVALWTRSPRFFDVAGWANHKALEGWTVVHGHSPTIAGPDFASEGPRINVDDGACFGLPGSRLTCARIGPCREIELISVV